MTMSTSGTLKAIKVELTINVMNPITRPIKPPWGKFQLGAHNMYGSPDFGAILPAKLVGLAV